MLAYYTQGIIIPIVYNIHYNRLLDVYHTGTIIHNMNFYSCDKRVSIQKRLGFFGGEKIFFVYLHGGCFGEGWRKVLWGCE